MPPALGERQRPQINAVQPEHIEGYIGGLPCVAEQVIELWPARFVGCDDLAVEYRVASGIGGGNSIGAMGGNGDSNGGAGIGAIGGAGGAGDMMGAGGVATSLADLATANAIAAVGLAGFIGPTGFVGALAALNTTFSAMYGSSPALAIADIAHDINLSMATSMSAGFAPNL